MKRVLISALALVLAVSCAGCAVIDVALLSATTPEATPVVTQEPTPAPTAAPTPEPVFTEITLNTLLFTAKDVVVTLTDIRFSKNYMTAIDISIENASNSTVTMQLGGVCLNRWQVDGALENAANVAPGETRRSTVIVNFQHDSGTAFMNLSAIAEVTLLLSLTEDFNGGTFLKQKSFVVAIPDAGPMEDPTQNTRIVYEDDYLILYLQKIDGSLQNTRMVLYHKPDAKWAGVAVYPVYAGYTSVTNRSYSLMAGKYRMIVLDGTDVFTRQNITTLSQLSLYLALEQADGRLSRPIEATITDPKVSETVLQTDDESPIVYQSALPYCILRYKGITEYEGHEVILLDLENTTQTNGTSLDITASASNPNITIDGTVYPLMSACTSAYPATHGCLLLWADGAPEGTLANATSVTIGLRLSRINSGKLEPILDTRDFSFDLK